MPQSIPSGLTRQHVLAAISDLKAGMDHPFGPATGYELVHDGERFAPKAIVGLAFRHLRGRVLPPSGFSGGEAPGQANFVLRRLGFVVVNKEKDLEEPAGKGWSPEEVQLIVADYFAMLEAELLGVPYKKSEHRRALLPGLDGRSEGSVEFKHQNISAVLVEAGLPYISGYKPRGNYQSLLSVSVDEYLDRNPGTLQRLAASPTLSPSSVSAISQPDLSLVFEDPPEKITMPAADAKPWLSRRGKRVDFAEQDARNRELAKCSEEFVFALERLRLTAAGRDDLAQKVIWASQDIGDGLGFDILSYDDADDSERLLEVKATGLGKFFPFYVTANELRCSEDIPAQYQLFRVFNFTKSPRIFILHGALSTLCHLDPVLYRATI